MDIIGGAQYLSHLCFVIVGLILRGMHQSSTLSHHLFAPHLVPWLTCADVRALCHTSHTFATDDVLLRWLHVREQTRLLLRTWRNHHALANHFEGTFLAPFVRQYDVPVLTCLPRFIGATDYIDGIQLSDLLHPIMVGVDRYRRPFLCVVYHKEDDVRVSDPTTSSSDDSISTPTRARARTALIENKTYLLTVFQRFTNAKHTWCRTGSWYNPILWGSDTCLNATDKCLLLRNLYALLDGGRMSIRGVDVRSGGGRLVVTKGCFGRLGRA